MDPLFACPPVGDGLIDPLSEWEDGATADCLACQLANGERNLPGGLIYGSPLWRVEHCIGPLGLGALIVKPGIWTGVQGHRLVPQRPPGAALRR